MTTWQGVVRADHQLFWVGVEDWTQFDDGLPDYGFSIPLLWPPPPDTGGAYVFTKVHTDLVGVQIEYHDERPVLGLDGWEDVDLIVVDCPEGDLCVLPLGGGGDFFDEIVPGPGTYAVRCAARGRDAADIEVSEDPPLELYRFDIWPAAPDDSNRTLKQTSECGRGVSLNK
ncbi:MAG: hypothetical protein REI45_11335 [Propionicimonas sp.]|nr:hypothetical protein [Propionicimonas sp.]